MTEWRKVIDALKDLPVFTTGHGNPDHCSEHGWISGTQSVAEHLKVSHGMSYAEFVQLREFARPRVECDEVCNAYLEPAGDEEIEKAYSHWRFHEHNNGCAHGR